MIIKRFFQLNENNSVDNDIKKVLSNKDDLYAKILNYMKSHLDYYDFEIELDHLGDVWNPNFLSGGELNIEIFDKNESNGDNYEFNGEEYQALLDETNLTKSEVTNIINDYNDLLSSLTDYLKQIKVLKTNEYADFAYFEDDNTLNILYLDEKERGDYYILSNNEYNDFLLYIESKKFNI